MLGNFVSELVKAAVIDLLFKRPINLQYARDPTGRVDFRASITPASGGNQQPVMYMPQQQVGMPMGMPMGMPGYGYPAAYPGAFPAGYGYQQPQQTQPQPTAPQADRPTALDVQIPSTFRR